MRTFPKYVQLQLDKFDDESMAYVNECRQAVGYQEDPAWNCPYIVASQTQNEDEHEGAVNDFLKQHEGKRIGGVLCRPCLVKESHDQHAKGITPLGIDAIDPAPFPLTNKPVEKFSNERCVELCNIINTAIAEERIVMADSTRIVGAFPNYGILCCILHAPWGPRHAPFIWIEGQTIMIDDNVVYSPGEAYYSTSRWKIPGSSLSE